MAELAVSCFNVVKIYPTPTGSVQALRGIDFSVSRGSVTAVVGPSGSGKSTLMRLLAGLDQASSGEVTVGSRSLLGLTVRERRRLRRRLVGYIGQRPSDNLEESVPVLRQIEAAGRFRGADDAAARALLSELGLADRTSHLPHQLSGGEQQRAAMARALVGSPALLLADEPTAELDRKATADICEALRTLADRRGLAAVVATHDVEVLAAVDHVIMLRDGAIQSETRAGEERAVIDATGRVQLPKELLEWFPGQRVRLDPDPDTKSVRIWPT